MIVSTNALFPETLIADVPIIAQWWWAMNSESVKDGLFGP
jgi:hypothetical protein